MSKFKRVNQGMNLEEKATRRKNGSFTLKTSNQSKTTNKEDTISRPSNKMAKPQPKKQTSVGKRIPHNNEYSTNTNRNANISSENNRKCASVKKRSKMQEKEEESYQYNTIEVDNHKKNTNQKPKSTKILVKAKPKENKDNMKPTKVNKHKRNKKDDSDEEDDDNFYNNESENDNQNDDEAFKDYYAKTMNLLGGKQKNQNRKQTKNIGGKAYNKTTDEGNRRNNNNNDLQKKYRTLKSDKINEENEDETNNRKTNSTGKRKKLVGHKTSEIKEDFYKTYYADQFDSDFLDKMLGKGNKKGNEIINSSKNYNVSSNYYNKQKAKKGNPEQAKMLTPDVPRKDINYQKRPREDINWANVNNYANADVNKIEDDQDKKEKKEKKEKKTENAKKENKKQSNTTATSSKKVDSTTTNNNATTSTKAANKANPKAAEEKSNKTQKNEKNEKANDENKANKPSAVSDKKEKKKEKVNNTNNNETSAANVTTTNHNNAVDEKKNTKEKANDVNKVSKETTIPDKTPEKKENQKINNEKENSPAKENQNKNDENYSGNKAGDSSPGKATKSILRKDGKRHKSNNHVIIITKPEDNKEKKQKEEVKEYSNEESQESEQEEDKTKKKEKEVKKEEKEQKKEKKEKKEEKKEEEDSQKSDSKNSSRSNSSNHSRSSSNSKSSGDKDLPDNILSQINPALKPSLMRTHTVEEGAKTKKEDIAGEDQQRHSISQNYVQEEKKEGDVVMRSKYVKRRSMICTQEEIDQMAQPQPQPDPSPALPELDIKKTEEKKADDVVYSSKYSKRRSVDNPYLRDKLDALVANTGSNRRRKSLNKDANVSVNRDVSFITRNAKTVNKKILINSFTQAGFSSPGVQKTNQDAFFIKDRFMNKDDHFFVGVCDGHGIQGHLVSNFVVKQIPLYLKTMANDDITKVFKTIHSEISSNKKIDSSMSGTTCVTAIINPSKIICANVGDSRAVLYRNYSSIYQSTSLSRDHKPNQPDECKRIEKSNGRVKRCYDDELKRYIGPERIWMKNKDEPGLAMTRSLGDDIAHKVGVIEEPEIKMFEYEGNESFMILASDGIWEYLSNDEVARIIKPFYEESKNPKEAATALVKEAFRQWKRKETTIDDITVVCVFFLDES